MPGWPPRPPGRAPAVADLIVDNDGPREALETRVREVWDELVQQGRHRPLSEAGGSAPAGIAQPGRTVDISARRSPGDREEREADATVPERNPETDVSRLPRPSTCSTPGTGAVKLLDSVIAAHPENTAARLLRARAFFAAAQLRPAELEFELVLELRAGQRAFAHFALARTFERSGNPERATRHFRLAAALDPKPEYLRAAKFDERD